MADTQPSPSYALAAIPPSRTAHIGPPPTIALRGLYPLPPVATGTSTLYVSGATAAVTRTSLTDALNLLFLFLFLLLQPPPPPRTVPHTPPSRAVLVPFMRRVTRGAEDGLQRGPVSTRTRISSSATAQMIEVIGIRAFGMMCRFRGVVYTSYLTFFSKAYEWETRNGNYPSNAPAREDDAWCPRIPIRSPPQKYILGEAVHKILYKSNTSLNKAPPRT
ncbi:hypothetical protein F4775DRAFT_606624 [Biscogniauxia sp. FL1348]|nr:hypothetical protein F4775DRAFT_606624 [Biscogniauxia sp. FL1348]